MKGKSAEDLKTLRDLKAGKYRDCYLVYNRKSTDDTNNQKNSIKYQKSENIRFAFREHLQIAALTLEGFATDGVVSERHSGFKEDIELTFGLGNTVQYRVERPKFHRLVQWLSQSHFKGVIFLCWDRASRNKGDDTILRKLMKAGVDVRFTLAQYDNTSSGALHMDIDGMFAEHHSRVTSEKVTITKRNLREQGVCTYKAPVGYLNPGNMYNKPFDPIRAPIIRQLFEMAATGEWSLADLSRWAIEQGFTMPPVRRRRTDDEILSEEEDDIRLEIQPISRLPTFNTIHKLLTNPFYTGRISGNHGAWVPSASHQALVPEQLFNRVQSQLRSHRQSANYAQFLDHPLRRILYCANCGRAYTPYLQKGITYYGARCDAHCENHLKNFSFDFIAGKIGELIARLSFSDPELAEIDARAGTDIAVLETKRLNQLEVNERRKKKIREDLAYLNSNRLMLLRTGAYTPESLVTEEARLNLELEVLKQDEDASDIAIRDTVRDVVKLSELLKNGAPYYLVATPQEKDRIIRVIFSELTVSENTLEYKCKKGFQALASRFIPSHDPIGWLSELVTWHDNIRESITEITSILHVPRAEAA
jgi:DNA invertase Pin-like site-specific DNA recombinase